MVALELYFKGRQPPVHLPGTQITLQVRVDLLGKLLDLVVLLGEFVKQLHATQ